MSVLQYIVALLVLLFVGIPVVLALGLMQFLLWVTVVELYTAFKGHNRRRGKP